MTPRILPTRQVPLSFSSIPRTLVLLTFAEVSFLIPLSSLLFPPLIQQMAYSPNSRNQKKLLLHIDLSEAFVRVRIRSHGFYCDTTDSVLQPTTKKGHSASNQKNPLFAAQSLAYL